MDDYGFANDFDLEDQGNGRVTFKSCDTLDVRVGLFGQRIRAADRRSRLRYLDLYPVLVELVRYVAAGKAQATCGLCLRTLRRAKRPPDQSLLQ